MTPPSFAELRTMAENARADAKAVRKKWETVGQLGDRNEDFERVLKQLDSVIQFLESWRGDASAFRSEAARETGDCHGVRGGTLRDWGKYEEATQAYDDGLTFEESSNRLGGQPNSYCLVQRLVTRVLWKPQEFQRGERIKDLDVLLECERALSVVRDQMKVLRKNDPWAQADVALLLQFLSEKPAGKHDEEDAESAWDSLDDLRPDHRVYASTLQVVKLIAERLCPFQPQCSWLYLQTRLTR